MSRFQQMRAHELVPYQIEEDGWGRHPECPVEVLDDGTHVWRVPPGSRVVLEDGELGVLDVQRWRGRREVLGVRVGMEIRWVDWRELRRLGYTAGSRVSDAVEAARATR